MHDDLLSYYNRELSHIREAGEDFAKAYPKVARHLGISASKVEDPDMARLIEAFAFLTAQVRYKIEDDFPEIAESLLNVLHPHCLSPVPAFSIVQFLCQPELVSSYYIPKNTLLETKPFCKETCHFKTVYPTTLWPIEVSHAEINDLPFKAPQSKYVEHSKAVLYLSLKTISQKMNFSDIAPGHLRFFLEGSSEHVCKLYEFILYHTQAIALAKSSTDPQAVFLDSFYIKSVGFDSNESLLPQSTLVSQGYDLLTEYFIFPEKFLFFELSGLDQKNLNNIGNHLDIYFYLDISCHPLEKRINADFFKLGCCPIINLFSQVAEPIPFAAQKPEYCVIPDARKQTRSLEVHSIEKVSVLNEEGVEIFCQPFYGIKHHLKSDPMHYFWHATRRETIEGVSQIFLSFSDLDFNPELKAKGIIHVETLCSNGDLPNTLPFGNVESFLQLTEKSPPIRSVKCLMPFSLPHRSKLRDGVRWKLVSHLSLNYLSLSKSDKALEILQEILRIYNFKETPENEAMIDSLLEVQCKPITARGPQGSHEAFCQGIEILVKLDETLFVGTGIYLFAQILDHFFARYATVNTFTRLVILTQKGKRYQWKPRAGRHILL